MITEKRVKKRKWLAMLLCLALLVSNLAVGESTASAACKITLKSGAAAPSSVYSGHSYTLKVAGKKVKFYSSNKKVATIGVSTGKLKPLKPGTVKITAKDVKSGKAVAVKTFKVLQRAQKISVDKDTLELYTTATAKITATKTPETSTDVVKFFSSDKSIASVGMTSGKVTAKKAGECEISVYAMATKATAKNNKSNKKTVVRVVVKETPATPTPKPTATPEPTVPPVESDVNAESIVLKGYKTAPTAFATMPRQVYYLETLGVPEEYDSGTNVTKVPIEYYSSDANVAHVAKWTGALIPLKAGTVRIIAKHTRTGEVVAARTFTVIEGERATSVSASTAASTMEIGETTTVSATKTPASATDAVRFFSTDSSIASVDMTSGVVTAKKAGNCQIEVYSMVTGDAAKDDPTNVKTTVSIEVKEAATPTPTVAPTPTVTPQYYPAYRPSRPTVAPTATPAPTETPTPTEAPTTEPPAPAVSGTPTPAPTEAPTTEPPAPAVSGTPTPVPTEAPTTSEAPTPTPEVPTELAITQVKVVSVDITDSGQKVSYALEVTFNQKIIWENEKKTKLVRTDTGEEVEVYHQLSDDYTLWLGLLNDGKLEEGVSYTIITPEVSYKFQWNGQFDTQSLSAPVRSVKLKPLRKLLATCVRFRHNGDMSVED